MTAAENPILAALSEMARPSHRESSILAGLPRYNAAPRNSEVASRISYAEYDIRCGLEEIIRRASRLLDALGDPERAPNVPQEIAQGAGASGPIGSQWERILGRATALEAILNYAIEVEAPA